MRAIATDADVSAALIVHHFGDKNALRAACDDHVVAVFIDDEHDLIQAPTSERIRAALNDLERFGPYIDYLARMLTDSSAATDRLFDVIVSSTRKVLDEQRAAGLIVEMSDPEMTLLLLVMMGLSPVLMRAQISRTLGKDQLSPAGLLRTTLPTMELLTHGIYSTPALLESTRQALGAEETNPTQKGAP